MHRGLVALSASAVAAIYMAGYVRTQGADASIEVATLPTVGSASPALIAAAAPPSTPTAVVVQRPTSPPAAAPAAGAYRDGTYTGQGTSRRGDVWVSLQVQDGRITNVTITRSTLQYPLRDIANLPQEVVQLQSAQVDVVSRATYSSMAFRGAVSQALASAKAA
jgi:uncharacterized protein with FMN-binding domain